MNGWPDQMLADVKIYWDEGGIFEHEPLSGFQIGASFGCVGFCGGSIEEPVKYFVVVMGHVDTRAAPEHLKEGEGIVVIGIPTQSKQLNVAGIDIVQQGTKVFRG